MSTKVRIWKKQEKRIVKLLYRKGLIEEFQLSDLYWAEYTLLHKRKRKHGRKYRFNKYAPEIHFSTIDYWGECDEHSLVSSVIDRLYWENINDDLDKCDLELKGYPKSTFNCKGRNWFINYLQSLPTKRNDCKINAVLYFNYT